MNTSPFSRRQFLRAAGVTLALPMLDSLTPLTRAAGAGGPVRRMVCVCTTLGIVAENLIPGKSGRDFESTPYLEPLKDFRGDLTVFSGVSHPDVDGGHSSEASFLTAAPHPGASSFRNTISLDQFALEKLPPATRFSSLVLNTGNGGMGLSVSRSGVKVPADWRPSEVFRKLFVNGSAREVAQQTQQLKDGQSIMDTVSADAKRLQNRVSSADREKLDDYFTTVREVEKRLKLAEAWAARTKPPITAKPPVDVQDGADFVARTRLMFDLMHLALQTDSTRFITLLIQGHNRVPPVQGVTIDWHNLSHHGKDPDKLAQLRVLELEQMKLLAEFLGRLKANAEGGSHLLANTMVLYGSNLGNASSHDTRNMPMLLAGGGFKHGQHLAGDEKNNTPLCQVYVGMLQRLGIETDQFASGKGRLKGLELA
jgi:hypothetical protein